MWYLNSISPTIVCNALKNKSVSHLPSADGSDIFHRLASLQLKRSAALHLLIPKLHSAALFSPVKYNNKHHGIMFIVRT